MKADKKLLDKIKDLAITLMKKEGNSSSNLSIDENIIKAGQYIKAGPKKIHIDRDTIMVFADDAPLFNWSHACRYFLYDVEKESGEFYKHLKAQNPPYLVNPPNTFQVFLEQSTYPKDLDLPLEIKPADVESPVFPLYKGERYAVLYSGNSQYQHVNDLEFIYRILIDLYGFNPDNIFVLNFDGTYFKGTSIPNYSCYDAIPTSQNWPGNNTPYRLKIFGDGTKDSLLGIFDLLNGKLKKDDLLLFHSSNHGSLINDDTESALQTYANDGQFITCSSSEFAEKLAALPKFTDLIVIMEQCYSGGFNDPVLANSTAENTSFMAACESDKCSTQGQYFDVFTKFWSKAISGFKFQKDTDQSNVREIFGHPYLITSVIKAFNSAKSSDDQDSPVYGNKPEDIGEKMVLGLPESDADLFNK